MMVTQWRRMWTTGQTTMKQVRPVAVVAFVIAVYVLGMYAWPSGVSSQRRAVFDNRLVMNRTRHKEGEGEIKVGVVPPTSDTISSNPHHCSTLEQNSTVVEMRSRLRYEYMRCQCENYYHMSEYDPRLESHKVLNLRNTSTMAGAYSNDDYNFTIFTVMKVGSWHWNNLMEDLHKLASPKFRRNQPRALTSLRDIETWLYLKRMREHYKILFVRNPLVRVLSAWRNKFVEHHSYWYKAWAVRMIKMFRKNRTRSDFRTRTPTLLEFVRYITESGDDEVHWKPVWTFYRPCRIHFDFIGKMETIEEDIKFVMSKLGIESKGTYRNSDSKRAITDLRYARIALADLPADIFQRLVRKYQEDFRLFGYHLPKNASDIR